MKACGAPPVVDESQPAPAAPVRPAMGWRRIALILGAAALLAAAALVVRDLVLRLDLSLASVSELRLRLERNPTDVRYRLELGRRRLVEQRVEEAEREVEAVLRLAPDHVEAHYLRGIIRRAKRDPVGALSSFERVLTLRPDHAPARLLAGIVLFDRSQFRRSQEMLTEYVRREPMDPSGYFWLGLVAFTSGQEKLGVWAMERAVALAPEVANYRVALSGFYLTGQQGAADLERALSELDRAARLAPTDWMVQYRLGVAYLRARRLREAAAALETSARLAPQAPQPYYLLPQVYLKLGNPQKAEHYARIARTLGASGAAPARRPEDAPPETGAP